jgi:hypothetical protein
MKISTIITVYKTIKLIKSSDRIQIQGGCEYVFSYFNKRLLTSQLI